MPSERESTTSVRTGDSFAARAADSTVPDIRDERWTDTTPSQPRSAARAYASANAAGPGRDVVTGVHARSASATVSDDVSPPSS